MHSAAAPGLNAPISPVLRASALGEEQQRHAVVEKAGGQTVAAAKSGAIDRESIEEQRGQGLRHQTSKK